MRRSSLPLGLMLALATAPGLAADSALRPEQLRQAMGLKLGSWRSTLNVVDVQVEPTPGADPAEAERTAPALRSKIGLAPPIEECLWDSPELVFIPGLRVGSAASGCTFGRVEARDGRFAVASICSHPDQGVRVEMAMDGSYTPETMASRFEVTTTTANMRIRIKASSESRFAGDCKSMPPIVSVPRP